MHHGPLLWLADQSDDSMPQRFAASINERQKNFQGKVASISGIDDADWLRLGRGPNGRDYWSAWDRVLHDATVTVGDDEYRIHQDGDVWLVPK